MRPIHAPLLAAALLAGCGAAAARPAARPTAAAPRAVGVIQGAVVDAASAAPLSFVDVVAADLHGRRAADTTRSDGRFRLADLAPGTYWLIARYAGRSVRYDHVAVTAGQVVEVAIPMGEAGEVTIDYAAGARPAPPAPIARTGTIRGVVRDALTREQLPGAVVAATPSGHDDDARMAIADDQGGYLLPGLPPGTYTLSVYYHLVERGNIEHRRSNISVAPGEIAVVDLELDAETDQ